jgi:hemolysin III
MTTPGHRLARDHVAGRGGLAYTLGIAFFALDRLRYFHATWHVFVLAGSVAHYFAILFYVVPQRP